MTRCIACNNESSFKNFKEDDKVIICKKCNAIFTKNPVSEKVWYEADSPNISFMKKIKAIIQNHQSKQNSIDYIKYLKTKTKMDFKKVLEVGANRGFFVDMMNELGVDTIGIESNKNLIKSSKSKKIKWGFFDKNYETKNTYDLICLTHMIYFLRDNYAILKKAKSLLSKNGMIFISTLNPESKFIELEIKTEPLSDWANMIFSQKNFKSLQENLGLELLDYTTYKSNVHIDTVEKNRFITFIKYFFKLQKSLSLDSEGNFAFILLKPIS